ncbi:MAG: hypothetical protein WCF26_09730 [Candidatus Sulfotelmatobacter sp.]
MQKFTVEQVSNSGKAVSAAISPDGRHVASVMDDHGMQSLWLRNPHSGFFDDLRGERLMCFFAAFEYTAVLLLSSLSAMILVGVPPVAIGFAGDVSPSLIPNFDALIEIATLVRPSFRAIAPVGVPRRANFFSRRMSSSTHFVQPLESEGLATRASGTITSDRVRSGARAESQATALQAIGITKRSRF